MNSDIFKKFTPNLKKTLIDADRIAAEKQSGQNTEHQLLAILQNKDSLAAEILKNFNILAERVEMINSFTSHNNGLKKEMAEDAKKSVQLAVQTASRFHHSSVGSEHLLLALISIKKFNSYLIIEKLGVDPQKIKLQIEEIFKGINRSFEDNQKNHLPPIVNPENLMQDDGFDDQSFNAMPPFLQAGAAQSKKESFLDQYSKNLTKLANNKKLDPVIGREKEINRLIQTLSRRTKNNPILVGEPGVGKTAIVEGLAQKIISGTVPEKIAGTEILSLDLGSILAGTMYRGQFESRIKKILSEIEKKGNIILFVDEIHMMVGAGSTEGSIDAANLLKPMLAKGQLRLIGSTTYDEYKKHIEKDPAFERRFQPIYVKEPSFSETVEILSGIKNRYEKFHNVRYSAESLEAAVNFSLRYIHDRFLPDKAIDLIDEAGAVANTKTVKKDAGKVLKKKLSEVLRKKEELISKEDYENATLLREEEIKLQYKIQTLSKQSEDKTIISASDIAKLVSDWTGIPVSTMSIVEKKNYLNLDKKLKKFVVGQDEAIIELSKAIKRSRVGIGNPKRPIGSFIFLGPTGVGKTELAKVLAREIFGSEETLVKIDMSEFAEKHNVARLIGAPAGYIGYEEGGKLTEKIRKNPYSVILFDEIEKAHPEVFNILLQIMDEGVLTDAKGRIVDFKNTIIILTSNLGTDILRRQSSIGFGKSKNADEKYAKMKDSVMETVEKTFRPEFINRLDKVIVFYPLNLRSIRKIVDLQLAELTNRLASKSITLKFSKEINEKIANDSYSEEYGARPIKKYIAEHIETPISDRLLTFDEPNISLELDVKNGKIIVL